jgi:excisionase family DNA binding protein
MQNAATLDLPPLYRLEELTKHVGITQNTAYRLIEAGRLPARRIGGRWYVTDADAKAFVAGEPAEPRA